MGNSNMISSPCFGASTSSPIFGNLSPQRDSLEATKCSSSSTGLSWSLGDSKVGDSIAIQNVESILGGLSRMLDATCEKG
jgi:hypothetical protein